MSDSSNTPAIPLLNNRYRLLAAMAAGGMATVYKAQDQLLNRLVAVKILRDRYARDPAFVQRFRDEATAAASLNHPNIVTVFDVGHDVLNGQDRHYIVMELVEGADLKQTMRQRATAGSAAPGAAFEIEEAVDLARQVCEGVGYAHKRGIVHCDLKPQNVLVTPDGRAKVTDFGIARAYTLAVDPNLREETVWGTPQYFAPEQAAGAVPTPASDVYSIGVMLYELLAGRLPFESSDPVALARMHQSQEPPALSARNPAVSSQLEGIVRRALAKDPAQRFRNADQMAATLSAWLQQGEERTIMGMDPVLPPDMGAGSSRAAPAPRPAARASGPSVQERINTRTGANPAKPAPGRAAPIPAPAGTGQYTVNSATSTRREGTDVLLLLLGAIALVCVLGLIPLYAKIYAEYTAPPAPAEQRQPQLAPAAVAAVPGATAPSTADGPRPTATQSLTATATPTVTFELPTNLVGSVLSDSLKALFAGHGVSVSVTETYSLEPQYTILAIDPATTTLSVSGTLTLTVSSGGRVDLGAQLPGVLIESAQFSRDDYAPGMNVQFEVTWRGTRNVGKDYSVFVHLHDPSGNFMAQTGDREPRNHGASYPTSIWNASTVVVDNYVLQIPLTAQPGLYEIRIGLYDGSGRLAVSEPGATTVKGSGVVVRTIRVH